jgi:hypothetical protein
MTSPMQSCFMGFLICKCLACDSNIFEENRFQIPQGFQLVGPAASVLGDETAPATIASVDGSSSRRGAQQPTPNAGHFGAARPSVWLTL